MHRIAKNDRPFFHCGCFLQRSREPGAVEDVVPQHQRCLVIADKLLANDKRFRQAVWPFLHRVFKTHAQLRPIP